MSATDSRLLLMVPGPADIPDQTRAVFAEPVLPHYGDTFLALWRSLCGNLQRVIGTTAHPWLVPGSGSAGTEMALCGFAGTKCIVLEGGVFGHRLAEVLRAHRAHVVEVSCAERDCVTPEMAARALKAHPDAAAVCLVHVETSTGVTNPIAAIADVVRDSAALCVVDGVSSVGGMEFRMDRWGVDICWAGSQKALASPAGLAVVVFNDRAFEFLKRNADHIAGWYLNPLVWKWHVDNWAWHPYPVTLPTHILAAMEHTLAPMSETDLLRRYDAHRLAASAARAAFGAVGFEPYPRDESFAAPTVTAVIPPLGLDEQALRDYLMREHRIMIAGGIGALRGRVIRVGHMGLSVTHPYILALADALDGAITQDLCSHHGVSSREAALAALQRERVASSHDTGKGYPDE